MFYARKVIPAVLKVLIPFYCQLMHTRRIWWNLKLDTQQCISTFNSSSRRSLNVNSISRRNSRIFDNALFVFTSTHIAFATSSSHAVQHKNVQRDDTWIHVELRCQTAFIHSFLSFQYRWCKKISLHFHVSLIAACLYIIIMCKYSINFIIIENDSLLFYNYDDKFNFMLHLMRWECVYIWLCVCVSVQIIISKLTNVGRNANHTFSWHFFIYIYIWSECSFRENIIFAI